MFPQFPIVYKKTLSVSKKDDGTTGIEMRIVEYNAFRNLMSYTNPLVEMMSINTLKSEIHKLYQAEKTKSNGFIRE